MTSDVAARPVSRRRLVGAGMGAGALLLAGRANAGARLSRRQGDPVTLECWGFFPEELSAFRAIMADFTAAHPEIEINISMTPTDQWKAKINSALNTGSGPDIFMANSQPQLGIDVQTGLLLDLTGEVDLSTLSPVARDAVTIDGQVWAVPTGRYTVGICYHEDLFEQAGIAAEPATWSEFRQVMDQLKEADITPYSLAAKDGSLTYFNYIGLASSVLGMDGFEAVLAGEKKLTDPDLVAVLEEMRAWEPYYQPNFRGTPYAEAKALFATKRTAMMDCGSVDLSGYYAIDPEARLGFFPWPAPEAGMPQVTNTGMNVIFGFNANTEHKDAVLAFARWIVTPEGGQSVANHNKVLPVVEGVEPAGDPVLVEMAATPLDVPVWYERWPTLKIGEVWTTDGNAAFDADRPPEEFAAKLQASVDEQLATPPA